MQLVENQQFSDVLISKLEYRNFKYISNDLLGENKPNFTLLKDFYAFRLNFKKQEMLNNFIDSLAKAETPQRMFVGDLFYHYGRNMEMESKIHVDNLLSVYSKKSL